FKNLVVIPHHIVHLANNSSPSSKHPSPIPRLPKTQQLILGAVHENDPSTPLLPVLYIHQNLLINPLPPAAKGPFNKPFIIRILLHQLSQVINPLNPNHHCRCRSATRI